MGLDICIGHSSEVFIAPENKRITELYIRTAFYLNIHSFTQMELFFLNFYQRSIHAKDWKLITLTEAYPVSSCSKLNFGGLT